MKSTSVVFASLLAVVGCVAPSDAPSDPEPVGAEPQPWDTESPTDPTKSTHQWIVNTALKMIRDSGMSGSPAQAAVLNLLTGATSCAAAWRKGINDADFLPAYNDGVHGNLPEALVGPEAFYKGGWRSHFFDADTGMNYKNELAPTAKTQALEYYDQSLDLIATGNGIEDDVCYALGVSLHYMTDVTQPMHASNFTNANRPLFFHGNFEAWAMATVQPTVTQPAWLPLDANTAGTIIDATAKASKALWAPLKQRYDTVIAGASYICQYLPVDKTSCWSGDAELQRMTQQSLGRAPQYAAQYLLRWINDVVPLEPGHKWIDDLTFTAAGPGAVQATPIENHGEFLTYLSTDANVAHGGGTWTFTATAAESQTLTFNWRYRGWHAFFQAHATLDAFADGPSGRTTVSLFKTDSRDLWDVSGTASLPLTKDRSFGFIVTGSNSDSNTRLAGSIWINEKPTVGGQ